MTKAFMQECYRSEFGSALPVSDSLLALSDQPIKVMTVNRESGTLDPENPRTMLDDIVFSGTYALPTPAEVENELKLLKPETRIRFEQSAIWLQFNGSWLTKTNGRSVPEGETSGRLSAKMVIGLAMIPYSCSSASLKYQGHFDFRSLSGLASQMHPKITPMMFAAKIGSVFFHSPTNEHILESVTVREVLHTVSRFPKALRGTGMDEYTLERAVGVLRPLAGDAWLSYLMLAVKSFESQGWRSQNAVETAVEFARIGIPVEVLQLYVDTLGVDPTLIRQALRSGITADVIAAMGDRS